MVAHERDRRAARERMRRRRYQLDHARRAHERMDLAAWRRHPAGLPPLPAGPATCPPWCRYCRGRAA